MEQHPQELSDNSMLGFISRQLQSEGVPKAVQADLRIYHRAVGMLDRGILPPDMFVMVSQGVIGRIKEHSRCRSLMSQYLRMLAE